MTEGQQKTSTPVQRTNKREECIGTLVSFVRLNYMIGTTATVPLDKSLVEAGILDSYAVIELVSFLEKEFQIVVPGEHITKEKFGSIYHMADYVMSRLETSA
jgi:acyl carrier protein